MSDLKLGQTVVDKVTGLRGTAHQFLEKMNGTRQVAIQPRGDGTTIPEAQYVDDYLIDVVDEGVSGIVPGIDKTTLSLGEKVREIASGQVGHVTSRATFLNGCVYLEVTTESTDNKNPDVFFVEHKRLEKVDDGIKEKVKQADTGGPMRRGLLKPR